MQPKKKFQLKELTLKITPFHVCKFNQHKAEWTITQIKPSTATNQVGPSNNLDMGSTLPMNSINPARPKGEEVDNARLAADHKQVQSKRVEAQKGVQSYEQKIRRVQEQLKQTEKVSDGFTQQWAAEKSKRLRMEQQIEIYKNMLKSKRV